MDERADLDAAIASQPHWMAQTARLAAAALPRLRPWRRTETVALIGMGASTHAGTVWTEALRAAGQRALNLDASAVAHYPEGYPVADHLVVVSESGRSPEPIAAVRRLGVAPVVITNEPDSPLARLGSVVVPLGGFQDSGVYTIGYTCTLVALAAVARACGVNLGDPGALAGVASAALADYAPDAPAVAAALDGCTVLDIVGAGTSYGTAQAAALLFREAAGLATAPYETAQYLHGPMESCGPGRAVWLFGDGREDGVAADVRTAGGYVCSYVTTPGPMASGVHRSSKPVSGYAAAVAEIVAAQLVAAELAHLRGREAGAFAFPQPDTKLPRPVARR